MSSSGRPTYPSPEAEGNEEGRHRHKEGAAADHEQGGERPVTRPGSLRRSYGAESYLDHCRRDEDPDLATISPLMGNLVLRQLVFRQQIVTSN